MLQLGQELRHGLLELWSSMILLKVSAQDCIQELHVGLDQGPIILGCRQLNGVAGHGQLVPAPLEGVAEGTLDWIICKNTIWLRNIVKQRILCT